MTDVQDTESVLAVGSPAVFRSDPLRATGPRYSTAFRGWRKANYILIDKPTILGRNAAIREGQDCLVQYVRDGTVCSFPSTVFDWTTRSHNAYCRIAWPESVRMESFRKHERVSADSPCQVYLGDALLEGVVLDVSIGGCRCVASEPLPLGTTGEITFTLPDGSLVERAWFTVRNVREGAGAMWSMGLEFDPSQFLVQNTVAFCVMSVLGRARTDAVTSHRVLVIDDNPEMGEILCQQLRRKGYDVFSANGPIDGFHRLYSGSVQILLLRQGLRAMDGLTACRAIQASSMFQSLALYVYGGAGDCTNEELREAGVRTCFPPSTSPPEIADAVYAGDSQAPRPVLEAIKSVDEAIDKRRPRKRTPATPNGKGMRSRLEQNRGRRRG
ncbi:MAG: hypothetical protein GWP08_08915 [Nitrospiraceae bacterium]|nr:hypothetical protein [Nitrospiraceae bacterium]